MRLCICFCCVWPRPPSIFKFSCNQKAIENRGPWALGERDASEKDEEIQCAAAVGSNSSHRGLCFCCPRSFHATRSFGWKAGKEWGGRAAQPNPGASHTLLWLGAAANIQTAGGAHVGAWAATRQQCSTGRRKRLALGLPRRISFFLFVFRVPPKCETASKAGNLGHGSGLNPMNSW